jgi:large subunit ribosomal protein LP1
MGVYTFVCRSAGGGEWTAKQHSGEIEASAATPYELQRRLVASASAADSASGVQSSFSMVTPSSAVFQVRSPTLIQRLGKMCPCIGQRWV